MGRRGTGVDIRGGTIRVRFTWQGKRCCETIDRKPTSPNIKHAERLVAEINQRIAVGVFKYADYFPDSPNARGQQPRIAATLSQLGDQWLKSKGRLSEASRSQYKNALAFWYRNLGEEGNEAEGGARKITEFLHGELAGFIGSYAWPGWQLCNNYLVPLRGLFLLAKKDRHITENPMDGIENMARVKKMPDPLSAEEAEKILADLAEHYDERVFLYFEFAFQTGMRPEELIALRWSDIDWNCRPLARIRVQRARSHRGLTKEVKNHEERDVDLSPRANAALVRMKKYTFLGSAQKESDDIFQNPVTGKPWHDERSQRDHYWNPALQRAGVRRRRAYATRHTYATRMIMGGANHAYVAYQMGHTQQVLFSTYARWLKDSDTGDQASKMAAILGGSFGPSVVQNSSGKT